MKINNKFNIGDKVFLILDDKTNKVRIVVGFHIKDKSIQYIVTDSTTESYHYYFEISKVIIEIKNKLGY